MFIAARGILGFGLALNITAAPLLIMELAYPSQRAPMVSIYNSLWSLGSLVAAWTTYGTFRLGNDWAWRIPSLLQALSSVLQLLLYWCIEESPRWLISKEKDEEARRQIIKYHANGDEFDPIVPLELEEIRTALRLEREASQSTSYLSFSKTPGNRKRFWIILAVSFFSQVRSGFSFSHASPFALSRGNESCQQLTRIYLVERQRSHQLLPHPYPRLDRLHSRVHADSHQCPSHLMESDLGYCILPNRQQIRPKNPVPHLNGRLVGLLCHLDCPRGDV